MDTVPEARTKMCAFVRPLGPESVELGSAAGRTLAETICADRDQPPFKSSAMDGYALRSADLGRSHLRIVGQSAAGDAYAGTVGPCEAVRIFTGARVPEGADCVVQQEKTRRDGATLFLMGELAPAANIREIALDFRAGAALVTVGTRLSARHVALIASAGRARIPVTRRPRVAVLATGTELRAPGQSAGPDQIYDSVSFGLAAMIESWGAHSERLEAMPDDEERVAAAAVRAIEHAELLVVSGGASVGDHDIVKQALKSRGLEILVPQIAVRPGKPTWFGTLGSKPVFGLPGNPTAAFVCAHLFLRPLLDALLRRTAPQDCVLAALEGEVRESGNNELYLRASVSVGTDARFAVRPFSNQDTSLVSVFAMANALIRRRPGAPAATSGATVETLLLD
jgi:molybdopterin molybdotransferase